MNWIHRLIFGVVTCARQLNDDNLPKIHDNWADCQRIVEDLSLDKTDSEEGDRLSKNIFGVKLSKGRPIGIAGIGVFGLLTVYFGYILFTQLSFVATVLTLVSAIGTGISVMFGMSKDRWLKLEGANKDYDLDYNKRHKNSSTSSETEAICRECQSKIPKGAVRCPNCGWKPEKKSKLWWGASAWLSLTPLFPVGWAMGAKGASDKHKASKGVSKEVPSGGTEEKENSKEDAPESSEVEPTDALEKLNELKNQGVITETEFEEKKKELLDRI